MLRRPEVVSDLLDRDLDFVDQDAQRWLAYQPRQAEIELDRMLVERFGLRMFIQLAWPTVESVPYKSNWHIDAGAEYLEAVSRGDIRRLVMCYPPRHMKSILVAVMWLAWDWIENPWRRFLFSSYAYELAIRDSVRCRRVIESPWYQDRWGDRFKLRRDQNTKRRFVNNQHGYRLSTSVDGQLTGEGGDFVVCDDATNVRRAESETSRESLITWFDEALSTRLNDPMKGAYVIIQQRVHEKDLVGHVLKKSPGEYTVLCLPAEYEPDHPQVWARDPRTEKGQLLWPEHVDRPTIENLKISLGDYAAAAQLQQRPSPREGGLFKSAWFIRRVKVAPGDCQWVRAWDWAASEKKQTKSDPDYTATVLLGWSPSQARWFVAHAARWREGPGEVRRIVKSTSQADMAAYGPRVRIEIPQDPGSAGVDFVTSMVTDLAGFNVKVSTVTGDKFLRADPVASQAQIGNIVLVLGDWNDAFVAELCGFPTGSHDDWVDSLTHAFNRMTGGRIGILDFYADDIRKRAEAEARAKAEQAARRQRGEGNDPPLVQHKETRDMGEGFRPSVENEEEW